MDSLTRKKYKKILRRVGKAIEEYQLIKENDRILAGVSGGKDSLLMLQVLSDLKKKAR